LSTDRRPVPDRRTTRPASEPPDYRT
jgi:hypothetical protein